MRSLRQRAGARSLDLVDRIRSVRVALLVSPWALAAAIGCAAPLPSESAPVSEVVAHPPYARYLRGLAIALDPGHGGDAHRPGYKRGPTGLREAEVNLRVALFLAEDLRWAGARVVLTRTGDDDVSLAERAAIANREGCDLFVSLHHNAVSDPKVNHTTVWVHGGPDERPASLDLARAIYQELSSALDLPQSVACPILSDKLMYPTGFGVLRRIEMPGVLCESSFYTHPEEERRLADPAYNRREAFGLFLGLARYAEGGVPRSRLLTPVVSPREGRLRVALSDGIQDRRGWGSDKPRILAESIVVSIDGERAAFVFDETRSTLEVPVGKAGPGAHALGVLFQNVFKHHNHPSRFLFEVAAE